jgi:hypothetical protein
VQLPAPWTVHAWQSRPGLVDVTTSGTGTVVSLGHPADPACAAGDAGQVSALRIADSDVVEVLCRCAPPALRVSPDGVRALVPPDGRPAHRGRVGAGDHLLLFSCSLLDAEPGLPAGLADELVARPGVARRLPDVLGRLMTRRPVGDAAVVVLRRDPLRHVT